MITILYMFLIFSFVGWLLDSAWCSYHSRRLVFSGVLKPLPICPVYGVGGLAVLVTFRWLATAPLIFTVIGGWLAAVLTEYLAGWLCQIFLGKKLWDYSASRYHLHGHVELLHSLIWLVLILILYALISARMRL